MTDRTDYHSLLDELAALPDQVRAETADIEHRYQRTVDEADWAWRREQERWKADDQRADDLRRQVLALARKVGVATTVSSDPVILDARRTPAALDDVRKKVDAANSSWQWILRQEERERRNAERAAAAPPPPPPPPVPVQSPVPTQAARPAVSATTLIAAAVVAILVVVLIAMLAL